MSILGFKARNHPQQMPSTEPRLFNVPAVDDMHDLVDDRGTDPVLFAVLNKRFRFTLDVAASHANAKCERYLTKDDAPDDGLHVPWADERVWCNPPYSDIRPWVQKAILEPTELTVMLLPANRTEQGWWQDLVEPRRDRVGSPLHVEFLRGRQRFVGPGKDFIGADERPPFGNCLLIWGNQEAAQ